MVDQLRTKEGGATFPITIGDFADVEVEGTFSLIFVISNTFFMLTDQEEQIRCFENVASHLDESGVFLVHAFVPDVAMFDKGPHISADLPDLASVRMDVSIHDSMNQEVDFRHLHLREDGIRMYPGRLRYVWPSELDLMARLAGFGFAIVGPTGTGRRSRRRAVHTSRSMKGRGLRLTGTAGASIATRLSM